MIDPYAAARRLGVQLPIVSGVLKSTFRALAKKLHTDTGGDKDAFIAMKEAYDAIIASKMVVESDGISSGNREPQTLAGEPLSSLGLGRKDNGQPCVSCSGKGYNGISDWREEAFYRCHDCVGSGFSHNWTGRYRTLCKTCHGRGTTKPLGQRQGMLYSKCGICDGTGEVAMFNPVIIKGGLGR